MAKLTDKHEKPPIAPIARYTDGTYRMPDKALNGGKPWYLYRVKNKDSWVSIASDDGWNNTWDFIKANLNTLDPKEVNWYLREYIGCSELSKDQCNYSFKNATPGFIWTRTPLATKHLVNMPNLVVNALSFPGVKIYGNSEERVAMRQFFNFRLNGYCLEPWMLDKARQAVAGGLLGVVHNPKIKADGVYYPHVNMLHLKSSANSLENNALIVHESVHIALDICRTSTISKAVSEGLAYVAQCVYYQLRNSNKELSGDADEALIFTHANAIATDLISNGIVSLSKGKSVDRYNISADQAGELIAAINGSTRYSGSKSENADDYDGIRDRYGDWF
jgi:hypothetical protein